MLSEADQATSHDQHGDDVGRKTMPSRRALGERIDRAEQRIADRQLRLGVGVALERHHQRGNRERGRCADHRRDQDVAERVGNDRARGSRRKAPSPCRRCRPCRRSSARISRRAPCAADKAGPAAALRYCRQRYAPPRRGRARRRPPSCGAAPRRRPATMTLQNAPIEQQRGQRADRQHQRQGAESEDEAEPGLRLGERQRPAAEIAEDEAGAGVGRTAATRRRPRSARGTSTPLAEISGR